MRCFLVPRDGVDIDHQSSYGHAGYQGRVKKSGPFTIHTRSSGSGSIDDPLGSARVTVVRPDGIVKTGESIYLGGKRDAVGFPTEYVASNYRIAKSLNSSVHHARDQWLQAA